jgi:hypothetical protein
VAEFLKSRTYFGLRAETDAVATPCRPVEGFAVPLVTFPKCTCAASTPEGRTADAQREVETVVAACSSDGRTAAFMSVDSAAATRNRLALVTSATLTEDSPEGALISDELFATAPSVDAGLAVAGCDCVKRM